MLSLVCSTILTFILLCRIGFAIAERLGSEGAKVVVSSRKQKNVDLAVEKLRKQGQDVLGLVCHVGSQDDRKRLFEKVPFDCCTFL